MLNQDQFSILVSLGCLFLLIASTLLLFFYFINKKTQGFINSLRYETFIKSIFVIFLSSIIGALIYQEYYNTPVCALCWQQRMLIYCVGIISFIGLLLKDKMVHYYIGVVSTFGLYIAIGHYYYHYLKYVKADLISLPCDAEGIACSESPIGAVFGFVTIPFMSICVFVPFIIISYFSYRKTKVV
jgi:disulfide bond formation protein DsbB